MTILLEAQGVKAEAAVGELVLGRTFLRTKKGGDHGLPSGSLAHLVLVPEVLQLLKPAQRPAINTIITLSTPTGPLNSKVSLNVTCFLFSNSS